MDSLLIFGCGLLTCFILLSGWIVWTLRRATNFYREARELLEEADNLTPTTHETQEVK